MKTCSLLSSLALFLGILSGCSPSTLIFKPDSEKITAKDAGTEWNPQVSEWYCKRKAAEPSIVLPKNSRDYQLIEILDIALANHPLTKQAWRQARAASFALGAAESIYYPSVEFINTLEFDNAKGGGVSSSGGGVISSGIVGVGYTQANVDDLLLSYLVLDFGGREASVRSAYQALQALNWTQNRVLQQVLFIIIKGYYDYIGASEQKSARALDLRNAEVDLESARQLYESGLSPHVNLLQAQASLENAKLALVSAENQVKITLGSLAVALGIPPSTEFGMQGLPEHFPLDEMTGNIDELMELAKKNRPDLASAYATLLQRKSDYNAAISNSLPTITASADLQRTHFIHNSKFDGYNYLGQIALNIPIFNGFLYENQIRQAEENIQAAKANFENLESLVLLDVLTAYYNFISSKKNLQYSESYLVFAEEAYEAALANFRNGTGSLLDLLATQKTLSDARTQKITARTSFATSIFNIAYATGTLNLGVVRESFSIGSSDRLPDGGACDLN